MTKALLAYPAIDQRTFEVITHFEIGAGTLNRTGTGKLNPSFTCDNCGCKRYSPCGCMRKGRK